MNKSFSLILLVLLSCNMLTQVDSQIPHCLAYASNGACTSCEVPFKISIGRCQNSVPSKYCVAFTSTLQCSMCNPDYYLYLNTNYYDCMSKRTNCLTFQNTTNNCVTCINGYVLNGTQGYCIIQNISNCYYQVGITCNSCNDGYDLKNNTCVYNISNCDIVNLTSCVQCSAGYQLTTSSTCELIPIPSIVPPTPVFIDQFCKTFDNTTFSTCIQCSSGYYFNSVHQCTQVDPSCKTFNTSNGACLSCYAGYMVNNNTCIQGVNDNSSINDPNCHTFDFTKNVCLQCADGSIFNSQGKCISFGDSNCQIPASDLSGCLICYKGYYYNSNQKKCSVGTFNCLTFNTNGTCASCPVGYYFDSNSNCTMIDPACKTFNLSSKQCITCYLGYALYQNLVCVQLSKLPANIKKYYDNCSQFDQSNKCISCYWGYYIQTDLSGPYCTQVSPFCRTFNSTKGACTSCYFGYYLTETGTCMRFM